MGLITEDAKPRVSDSILSNAELVRPQSRPKSGTTVVSGRQSVALQKGCLVYRSVQAGHKVVNVIPLRSIESFSLERFIRSVLVLALVLLSMSAATGLWWYAVLGRSPLLCRTTK
jgi:hypothetical protein